MNLKTFSAATKPKNTDPRYSHRNFPILGLFDAQGANVTEEPLLPSKARYCLLPEEKAFIDDSLFGANGMDWEMQSKRKE